ncbi:hypothetical protein CN918_30690 [Priestia megaterium]|nr:hypothetical protein CN918_30690 [Priestia megaterium]
MSIDTRSIYQYLSALHGLQYKPVTDISQYDHVHFFNDWPNHSFIRQFHHAYQPQNWLEVEKVEITNQDRTPPPLPRELQPWLAFDPSDIFISKDKCVVHRTLQGPNETINFEDESERVDSFARWIQEWNNWRENLVQKKEASDLYGKLFNLLQEIDRNASEMECCIGLGVFTWQIENETVRHPLFTVKADLTFDKKTSRILLSPIPDSLAYEQEVVSRLPLANITTYGQLIEEVKGLDVLEHDYEDFIKRWSQIISTIHHQGVLETETPIKVRHTPVFYPHRSLFVRNQKNRVLKIELDAINEGLEKKTLEAPKPVLALTESHIQESDIWHYMLEDIYFPLPSNEEQKEIVRKLAYHYGVTVQGPPGTGKTLTISNLVSHLLAHGKKVLITSQTDKALTVLKDKLPKDIQDLCVPVLGSGRDSMQLIENSINTISIKVASENVEGLSAKVTSLRIDLQENKKEEARLRQQIQKMDQRAAGGIKLGDESLDRTKVAQYLHNHQHIDQSWLLDSLSANTRFPLSHEEFVRMWQLSGSLTKAERQLPTFSLPSVKEVYTPEDMSAFLNKGRTLLELYNGTKTKYPHFNASASLERLVSVRNQITNVLQSLGRFRNNPALFNFYTHACQDASLVQFWKEQLQLIKEKNEQSIERTKAIMRYAITLPADKALHEIEQHITSLQTEYTKGKLSLVFKATKAKKMRYLLQEPVIDNHPILTKQDADVLFGYIALLKHKQETATHWNNLSSTIGYESVTAAQHTTESLLNSYIDNVEHVLDTIQNVQELADRGRAITTRHATWSSESTLEKLEKELKEFESIHRYQEWEKEYYHRQNRIEGMASQPLTHGIVHKLKSALEAKNESQWKVYYEDFCYIKERQQNAHQLQKYLTTFGEVAPKTKEYLEREIPHSLPFPEQYKQSWMLQSLKSWLESFKHSEYEEARQRLKHVQEAQRKIIEQIVVHATWRNQIDHMTDDQMKALGAWKTHMKRFGKGTSKYGHIHMKNAQEAMKECKEAIPVWIMPLQQVRQNFAVDAEKFDVVIFDESSQCDIYSLSILMRAKKVLIVGDSEQIVPSSIGTSHDNIHQMRRQYLKESRIGKLMDLKTSLYDLGEQIFTKESRLMLCEHFRCVPDIIQFSNDLSYNGRIIPLRLPLSHEKFEQPLQAIAVDGGFVNENKSNMLKNIPEAEAIADDIAAILEDSRYDGQTIGVISLQGRAQAQLIQNKLRERIGEHAYLERNIRCGDAYDFQGDERDVIYLSMVVASNRGFKVKDNEDDQRRYNVAVSRARNQIKLFHSVEASELKPHDLRSRLLAYCQDPHRIQDEKEDVIERCESVFEKEVAARILAKGYRVIPQVEVGRSRLDLVIEGLHQRLVVECDGEQWHGPEKWEEDMQRQDALERAGWVFWRIRGGDFYFDKDKSLEPLWTKLEELQIEKRYA